MEAQGGGQLAAASGVDATSLFEAAASGVGLPLDGSQSDEDGALAVLTVRRALRDSSTGGMDLAWGAEPGQETGLIWALGSAQAVAGAAPSLGRHSARGYIKLVLSPPVECDSDSLCSGNGRCDLGQGGNNATVSCVCQIGYRGSRCDECATGFADSTPAASEGRPSCSLSAGVGEGGGGAMGPREVPGLEVRLLLAGPVPLQLLQDEGAGALQDLFAGELEGALRLQLGLVQVQVQSVSARAVEATPV